MGTRPASLLVAYFSFSMCLQFQWSKSGKETDSGLSLLFVSRVFFSSLYLCIASLFRSTACILISSFYLYTENPSNGVLTWNYIIDRFLTMNVRAVHGLGLCPTCNRPAGDRVGRCWTRNWPVLGSGFMGWFPVGWAAVLGEAETRRRGRKK